MLKEDDNLELEEYEELDDNEEYENLKTTILEMWYENNLVTDEDDAILNIDTILYGISNYDETCFINALIDIDNIWHSGFDSKKIPYAGKEDEYFENLVTYISNNLKDDNIIKTDKELTITIRMIIVLLNSFGILNAIRETINVCDIINCEYDEEIDTCNSCNETNEHNCMYN
jgi:hypothetical protein